MSGVMAPTTDLQDRNERMAALTRRAGADNAAWDALVELIYPYVYRFPQTKTHPLGTSWTDDWLSEWFGWVYPGLRAALCRYEGRDGARFNTFMYRVLQYRYIDWRRHCRRQWRFQLRRAEDPSEPGHEAATSLQSGQSPLDVLCTQREFECALAALDDGGFGWRDRLAVLLPELTGYVKDEDLEELAALHGETVDVIAARLVEVCGRAESDLDLVDLLVPPNADDDRSRRGVARRQNSLQQRRSRALRKLRGYIDRGPQ